MIAERRVEVMQSGPGGRPSTFTRILEVDGPRPEHPVICFHGNPSSADDWRPFMECLEGKRHVIAPDLLGWGEADRPDSFHWTMDSLAAWIGDLIDTLGVRRFDLAMHDWGSVALLAALRRPESVDRLVIINTVPMTPDYQWHWIARLWRRRGVGEALNATTTRFSTRQLLRQGVANKSARLELADRISEHFDRGTKRAVLELYRDADPEKFAPIREGLKALTGPALVLWGDADPYLAPRFGDAIAGALGGEATVEHVAGAGHWPWLDRPQVVESVCRFLAA